MTAGPGTVVGRVSGGVLSEREISLCVFGDDRWISVPVAPDGRFTLRGLNPGLHRYWASSDPMPWADRWTAAGHFDVRPAGETPLLIRLTPVP
ncbi:MAG: hypothetical protein QM723_15110 [Myxococcaceae bacterium]